MQEIEFIARDEDSLYWKPQPAKKCIPEWFKNLPVGTEQINPTMPRTTAKSCIPLSDMITSGYIIFNEWETDLLHVDTSKEAYYFENTDVPWSIKYRDARQEAKKEFNVNLHDNAQCPLPGHTKDFFKVYNRWQVKTPPGYSCLFMQPFYHMQTGYQMLPAIVDTDTHDCPVEFNGYMIANEVTLKPGDPLMQVIPFKRDSWKSKFSEKFNNKSFYQFWMNRIEAISRPLHTYRKYFHSKKKFD